MEELKFVFLRPAPFFMDAQAAIQALKNPVFHARAKHISIKFHWLRQHVDSRQNNTLVLRHVRSEDMVADLTTKDVVMKIWTTLFNHLMGKTPISSNDMIVAQKRPKGTMFPV